MEIEQKENTNEPVSPSKRTRRIQVPLTPYENPDTSLFEIGLGEVGRGPLFGRVYAAAVILPKTDSFKYLLSIPKYITLILFSFIFNILTNSLLANLESTIKISLANIDLSIINFVKIFLNLLPGILLKKTHGKFECKAKINFIFNIFKNTGPKFIGEYN